ncbi:MAG: AEC family transporter [Betaproteobacteria bacterium HGW-Betaproteobacteria-11]|nr:MAG: AEC family transporter [Betaproteobacteria bacterium HGW-Betaproteobacteria-11]
MSIFFHHLALASPLFALVALGYGLMRFAGWPTAVADAMTRFVFAVALPAMLFRLMSDFSKLPAVDSRLLIAFFGSCLVVFVVGRLIGWRLLRLDGVAQSVFALGGVFSNNVLLGIPLARATLGESSLPVVALVLVFNSLILWTLVTVSVEWARHGSFSPAGFAKTAKAVATNPIVASIVSGTLYGLAGLPIPPLVDAPLAMLGQAAAPLSLVALGMGLAEYGIRAGWQQSASICALKLVLQPLVVWLLARLLGLPRLETQVVVLLAALPVGANVYLMSRQFKVLEGPVAAALVLSTALAAITAPLVLTLLAAGS